jgi:hypothetical protein
MNGSIKTLAAKRRGRLASVLALVAVVATVGAASALAAITSTSGTILKIAPPASVVDGALENDDHFFAFDEKQCVTLTSDLAVDITPGGGGGTIPAGTGVSSQFIHFDATGTRFVSLSGSITVDQPVLGVATSAANLDASDFLGTAGAYPTGDATRGFEAIQGDSASISGGQLTVNATVNDRFHFDQARVITACPPPPPPGDEGCTPGYWKQSQHFDSWVGYTQSQKYEAVFGVDVPGDPNLLQALQANGGGIFALERHSTAALLNASNPDVDYPLTESQVIAKVQAAVANGTIEQTKNELEKFNQLGCPIS